MAQNGHRAHARLLKALGHPARLQILSALRDGEECVCHLAVTLNQRQAYVSQQLIFLRRAGLIADRREGQRVYYQVKDPRVFDLIDDLEKMAGQETRHANLDRTFAKCPCPKCKAKRKR